MTPTVAERITFNQLTEDDFTDKQIVRMQSEIRQLAMAMSHLPAATAPIGIHERSRLIAKLSVPLATGISPVDVSGELLAMLTSYAETSLKVFGEGSES